MLDDPNRYLGSVYSTRREIMLLIEKNEGRSAHNWSAEDVDALAELANELCDNFEALDGWMRDGRAKPLAWRK